MSLSLYSLTSLSLHSLMLLAPGMAAMPQPEMSLDRTDVWELITNVLEKWGDALPDKKPCPVARLRKLSSNQGERSGRKFKSHTAVRYLLGEFASLHKALVLQQESVFMIFESSETGLLE